MTLRIERVSTGGRVIIRLIGRMQSEHLADLETEIGGPAPKPALDLEEVTLVDLAVVRFLIACEDGGVNLLHCSPYIRRWMARERSSQA
jgi:glutathione S-transferase